MHADYRELPFADESFDAALNLFTSLGYLGDEDDTRVLWEIRRVLRPGARLVIETLHRDCAGAPAPASATGGLRGEGGCCSSRATFDPGIGRARNARRR